MKLIYYEFKIVQYSSYYIFYSDFFTIIHQKETQKYESITVEVLIGVVYRSIVAVLLIIGIIIFLIWRKSKEVLPKSNASNSRSSSSGFKENQTEIIDHELHELAFNDDDKWI